MSLVYHGLWPSWLWPSWSFFVAVKARHGLWPSLSSSSDCNSLMTAFQAEASKSLFQSGSLKSSASGSSRATTDNFHQCVHRPPAAPLRADSPGRDLDVRCSADHYAGGDTEDTGPDDWMSSEHLAQSTRGRTLDVPLRG